MPEKLIFVSCGQWSEEEKALGRQAKEFIDAKDGFFAYFAETVHDVEGLTSHIFDAIRRCAGMVAFLHGRGVVVLSDDREWGIRSSVWVNQELAILAYRRFFEDFAVPVLVFKDPAVRLEGAMTAMIVNPVPIDPETLERELNSWLDVVAERTPFVIDDQVFEEKWTGLSDNARSVLACLLAEGGQDVHVNALNRCLQNRFVLQGNNAFGDARRELMDAGVIRFKRDPHYGDEISIHDTWKWKIARAVSAWINEGAE